MKKILITGGTGFIGTQVVEILLKKGYEVHLIIHNKEHKEQKNLIQHRIDLLNLTEVNNFFAEHSFKILIHMAWFVGRKCHVDNVNIEWIISSLNILKKFVEAGGEVFLSNGTVSEYDFSYGLLREGETPLNNGSLHGICKSSFYRIAKQFCEQNNVIFKWPRIFNLYGPYEKINRLMPSVITSCLKNEDVQVSNCTNYQDYLYVKDTAKAIVDILEGNLNDAINVCSGEPVKLKEIVNLIVELTNFKGRVVWGALPSAIKNKVVFGQNFRLQSLGWCPDYNLKTGLEETIEWWKLNNV